MRPILTQSVSLDDGTTAEFTYPDMSGTEQGYRILNLENVKGFLAFIEKKDFMKTGLLRDLREKEKND
jgi:hypothetical protein